MRIAILSESPTLPTGFARTTRTFLVALATAGHDVVCFSIGLFGDIYEHPPFPGRLWAAGTVADPLYAQFRMFIEDQRPDLVLINYDLITTLNWFDYLRTLGWSRRTLCHVVIDGLPVDPIFLRPLSDAACVIVPTKASETCVRPHVQCPVYYFPHLVDLDTFRPNVPLQEPGIRGDQLIVGCVAQNKHRKQLQQVLQAIRLIAERGTSCALRLHTDSIDSSGSGGDNLARLVRTLGLESTVIATTHSQSRFSAPRNRTNDDVADIIRGCHCMLVTPSCGGFEYGILEGQACAVPVVVTQDGANLEEVAGGAAYLVKPDLYDFTGYGAKSFRTSAVSIANAIQDISTDAELNERLVRRGLMNAAQYSLARRSELADILGNLESH